jgi:hypothetical protein
MLESHDITDRTVFSLENMDFPTIVGVAVAATRFAFLVFVWPRLRQKSMRLRPCI